MFGRHESEMQALLGADRAIAGGHHGKVGGAFETHQPAMAATGKGSRVGHRRTPSGKRSLTSTPFDRNGSADSTGVDNI
jgi:hypothetical protein